MHRCSWCGKPGHKKPTCPTRRIAETSVTAAKKKAEELTFSTPTSRRVAASAPKGADKRTKKPAPVAATQWSIAETVLPHCSRTLLYGPPGTGKTTAGNLVASEDIEVYNVTLTEEMPAAELRGHYVPKGGEFIWVDGPAMQAYRNGGRLVLNEIDRGSADALIFCYALLDDPGISRITLPTGESVRPHENFSVVATTNGEPSDLPEALQDRFDVRIYIDKPHPNAMLTLPEDLRKHAHNAVSGAGESRVSFRQWKAFAKLRDLVGEEIASKAVFSNRATAILDTIKLSRVSLYDDGTEPEYGWKLCHKDTVFAEGDVLRRVSAPEKEFTVLRVNKYNKGIGYLDESEREIAFANDGCWERREVI